MPDQDDPHPDQHRRADREPPASDEHALLTDHELEQLLAALGTRGASAVLRQLSSGSREWPDHREGG